MSLLDAIKRDANAILTNTSEFAEAVRFIAPTGEDVTVNAIHTKHHLGYDLQAAMETNTLKAHIAVSEQELTDLGYPVRNSDGEVDFDKHRVRARDDRGVEWIYVVQQWFPNDKVGVIALVLARGEG